MKPERKTGLVYHEDYLLHDNPGHPENKQRLKDINALLRDRGILEGLTPISPREAEIEEIQYVHPRAHIDYIATHATGGLSSLDMDTYVNEHSFPAARLAAGGVLTAVDRVMNEDLDNAFCLVRPPGHHAEPDRAMGFCLFNNVAIAAHHAVRAYGLERILILDWDVHHGNGTQTAFYSDPRVLYFSVHQHFIFPGTGAIHEVGAGDGRGYTVNVPYPGGCSDAEYELALRELLMPLCADYRPQLVLVSAGQDCHEEDPLAGMNLTSAAFGRMTESVKKIADEHADARVVMALEGGYSRRGAPEALFFILDALAGLGAERPEGPDMGAAREEAKSTIQAVQKQLDGT